MMKKIFLYIFIFASISQYSKAQMVPLEYQVQNSLNGLLLQDPSIFTGFRSMDWLEWSSKNSLHKTQISDSIFGMSASENKFGDRVLRSNWLQAQGKNYIIVANPILDGTIGRSSQNGSLLNGDIGADIQGVFFNKLSFGITGYWATNQFPEYMNQYIAQNDFAIPGEKEVIPNANGHYHYTHFDGYLSYIPNSHITLTAGYGKQFIGDGYRSLLWSDFANSSPYLRLKASYWRFNYNAIYTRLDDDAQTTGTGSKQGKYSVSHYLGVTVAKKWQFGFFENLIWTAKDSNYNRGFDVQYLNPLPMLWSINMSLRSQDNELLGFTAKYKLNNGYLYGQLGFDDMNIGQTIKNGEQTLNNKYFFQIGMWNHDIFHVKGLDWRLEWNGVRPYTYGHRTIVLNYTNNHQPLTDPWGANFHEFISIFNYNYGRWYAMLEDMYTLRGENAGTPYNNGENLWGGETGMPFLGSKTLQGIKHHYFINQFSVGYLINPRNRLSIQGDVNYYLHSAQGVRNSEFIFSIGVKTNLFNRYYDVAKTNPLPVL